MKTHVRWMIRRDMAEVLEIERQGFGDRAWREEDFIRCLRQRNVIGMVAEIGEQVVGFMVYEVHKTRIHVLNFAVAEEFRRQGVGQCMGQHLAGKLSYARRNRITLEVRETNIDAQHFFHSLGFRAVTILRGFYEDADPPCEEDAYLFQLRHESMSRGTIGEVLDAYEGTTNPPLSRVDRMDG